MTALFTSFSPLTRTTLARAEQVNALFQAIADGNAELPTPAKIIAGTVTFALDTGAADAYVVTLDPAPLAYSTGQTVDFKATEVNTGASTINVNALGVKSIRAYDGAELVAGQIPAGSIVTVRYDGTVFRLNNVVGVNVPEDASVTEAKLGTALSAALPRIGTGAGQVRVNSDLDLRYAALAGATFAGTVNFAAATFTGSITQSGATTTNLLHSSSVSGSSAFMQFDMTSPDATQLNLRIGRNSSVGVPFVTSFFIPGTTDIFAQLDSSNGDSSPSPSTVQTREKADGRFAPISSSRRFKTNLTPAPLVDISSLTRFDWIWGGELGANEPMYGRPGSGLTAEDVHPICPDAVRIDALGRPAGLYPLPLIAVLFQNHNALAERVAALEAA